ncbi:MAG: hypothetical protein ACTHU0_22095 [Kofleriaceae bacterium]
MRIFDLLRITVVGGAVVAAIGSTTSQQPQQTGYYPRPQQAQQEPPPPPPAYGSAPAHPHGNAQAASPAGTCDALCNQVARCDLAPYDQCIDECRRTGAEQRPAQLASLAQSSCAQLATLAQSPPPEQVAAATTTPAAKSSKTSTPSKSTKPSKASTPAKVSSEPSSKPTESSKPKESSEDAAAKSDSTKHTQWVCNAMGSWQKCETQGYACFPQMSNAIGFGSTEALARMSAQSQCTTAMSRLMSVNFAYRTSVTAPCHVLKCTPPNER